MLRCLLHFLIMTSLTQNIDTSMALSPPQPSSTSANTSTSTTTNAEKRIDWLVRPARVEDKEAVEILFHAAFGSLLAKDYDSDLLKIALPRLCGVRPELLTSSTWYVVEHPETGKLVGCGGWTPQSPFQEDVPHLRHFATDPQFTRQGIARALWDRTWKDWCAYYDDNNHFHSNQESHCCRPDMEVFSTITAASFYSSLGFETIQDTIIIPLAENCAFPAILMRRPDSSMGPNVEGAASPSDA